LLFNAISQFTVPSLHSITLPDEDCQPISGPFLDKDQELPRFSPIVNILKYFSRHISQIKKLFCSLHQMGPHCFLIQFFP
jgi:hypothetical protein